VQGIRGAGRGIKAALDLPFENCYKAPIRILLVSLIFWAASPNADAGSLSALGNATAETTAGFVRGTVQTVKYIPETINAAIQLVAPLLVRGEQEQNLEARLNTVILMMHHYTNRWQNLAEEALGIQRDTAPYQVGVFCGGKIVPLILLGFFLRHWSYRVAKKTAVSQSRRDFYWRVVTKMSWRTFLLSVLILLAVVGIEAADPTTSQSQFSASVIITFLLLFITVPPVVLISTRGATSKAFAVAAAADDTYTVAL
jgi:hypothetical protein